MAIALNDEKNTGLIVVSPFNDRPPGFLLCDGSAISRSTFSALFSVIGVTYGTGNGTTTFNIPDFRGIFPRGVGNPVGYTDGTSYNVTLGQKRDDVFQGHTHDRLFAGLSGSNYPFTSFNGDGFIYNVGQPINSGYGNPRLSTETAPKSLGVNFFIKF